MSTVIILIVSFAVFWLMNRYLLKDRFQISFIGRVALAVMLIFTSIAHFIKTEEMVQMIPGFLPYKAQLVYLTGLLEFGGAIGLLFNQTAKFTSVALIFFFILILPANIIGSIKKVELGGMENGSAYLYFRIPLQILFIWWTYYFGIKRFQEL